MQIENKHGNKDNKKTKVKCDRKRTKGMTTRGKSSVVALSLCALNMCLFCLNINLGLRRSQKGQRTAGVYRDWSQLWVPDE